MLDAKRVEAMLLPRRTVVRIFLSSTFTDTAFERDLFVSDAVPFLRLLCQRVGA